jgi:hypothetical protein
VPLPLKKYGEIRMARLALLLIIGLLVIGCDAKTVAVETDPQKTTYSRDARTQLCFATIGRAPAGRIGDAADSFSVTNVPCTEAVMGLVPARQRE